MEEYLGTIIKKRAPKGSVRGFHPCPTCGEVYENVSGHKKYCSKECQPKLEKICEECGSFFFAKMKVQKCCSVECRDKNNQAKSEAKKAADPTLIACKICGISRKHIILHLNKVHKMTVAEYKELYPGAPIVCESTSTKLSENVSGEKNVWFNHGGKLSPFSTKFVNYENLTEEEKEEAKQKAVKDYVLTIPKEKLNTSKHYWMNKGMSEEEAEKTLSARQSTFSLEKCIQKHGEEKGLEVFTARQEKWISTLNSKPEEEQHRINRMKMTGRSGAVSKISTELFSQLPTGGRFGVASEQNEGEVAFRMESGKLAFIDYILGNKCIEFNGDYWHANPKIYKEDKQFSFRRHKIKTAKAVWEADAYKIDQIQKAGFEVLIIWESDYRKDKQGTIQKCLHFLEQN